ncbi:hypothetical protein F0L68_28640 [Solihabitans fulvus]|uniref:PH domain-containing protein n=1 Tax=Solihabitans fulvus TaxID=1892852 RepID=A0A5B2WTJ9_9PSEU|nr:hypothetical protein [Solihabitans fulvus]KAA2255373.1 hypothetical protein F0L68_28640 [Solihabitans fulvus]
MGAELLPSEEVLWTGSPVRFPVFDAGDILAVLLGLVWFVFAIFWTTTAAQGGAPAWFLLWGVVFMLMGLYMAAGRLLVRWLSLRSTNYTVTNLRLIATWTSFGSARERSRYLSSLEPPVLSADEDGVGTIRFGEQSAFQVLLSQPMMMGRWNRGQPPVIELRAISNARFVRDLIVATRSGQRLSSDSTSASPQAPWQYRVDRRPKRRRGE